MPVNGFNIGIDCTVVLQAVANSLVLGKVELLVTGFEAKQITKKITVEPLNSPPLMSDLPAGWEGTFTVQRSSGSLEAFVGAGEANYWGGGAVTPTMQIFQYVNNPDGSRSTYRFNGAQITLENAGNYKQETPVEQQVSFRASTRTGA